jgi:uncharacterized Zn-binding protein involved in type VI secretion
MCTHSAPVSVTTASARVKVSGQPVATASDNFTVTGCPFFVASVAQPCVKINWLRPAARVFIDGKPAVVQTSTGVCVAANQAVQGPPQVIMTQTRVRGM